VKFIGQYIQQFIARFRADVFLENIGTSSETGVLVVDSDGKITKNTSISGGVAGTVTVADESTDTTCFPAFVTAATGDLALKTGSNLSFNSNTGALTATSFVGPLTGQADTVATIAGLAPNTATTAASQPNITSVGTLSSIATSGDITLGSADPHLLSNGDMTFVLDNDNDSSSVQSFKFHNNTTHGSGEIASLDELGNLQIDGGFMTGSTSAMNSSGVLLVAAQTNITSVGTLTGLTVSGDPSFTSDSFTITSATSTRPTVTITNSNTDQKPSTLVFKKSATGADSDNIGVLAFNADNDADQEQNFAFISGGINTAADSDESGILDIFVLTSDGSAANPKSGFKLTGSNANNDVDVIIGSDSTSLTTITGDLQVNGNDIKDDDGTTCITFDSSGNTTISNDLTVGGVAGDATLVISADTDNATETDNARLWFKQDGDITEGAIQMSSNVLNIINNISAAGGISFQTGTTNNTGTTDPATGATERMSIASDGTITVDGITSTPSSGAAISLNSSSATGSPYIEFTQNGTRRTFIQHNDTDNTLKLASEFGAISLLTGTTGTNEAERLGISSAGVVSTSGDLTVGGDLTVSGNDIKDSGGNTAIALNGTGGFTTPDNVTFSKTVTVGGAGSTFALGIRTSTITLNTLACNNLHTTPHTLVSAAGANTVILPISGLIRVDRAATQTNSASNMDFHYADQEPGTYGQTSLFHIRRFMYNDTGDRVFTIVGLSGAESSQNLTDDVNKDLEVSVASALTTNCITSLTIYLNYHVFDIS